MIYSLKVAFTLFIGLIGSLIFLYLDIPMPWLLGAISITALLSRFRIIPLEKPSKLSPLAKMILGVTIGGAFTPEMLEYLGSFIASLLFVIPFVLLVGFCGVLYYWKFLKYDKLTAFFSAMPGGLLEMVTIGEAMGANVSKITLVQSTRVLFIVFSLPFIILLMCDIHLDGLKPITKPFAEVDGMEMLIMVIVALVGAKVAKKLKISGSDMIGPMMLSVIFHLTGLLESKPPDEVIRAVQIILGTTIGFVFYNVTIKEMSKVIAHTFGYFLILLCICGFFIGIVHTFFDFPLLSVLLAFSPGGQSEINLIAILLAVNIPYVALHHIVRLFLVMSIAPLFAKKL